ncbi:hypothetical protein CDL15_Pgr005316 [Punica granatum]|uniref:Uncharacterized protein n=1 Tax=Punica granatum TaxID=22663 RepID=A0A218XDY6_PUNGR|nr:hypothetical protein CDL15_Pgr005316 [Punica granatum]
MIPIQWAKSENVESQVNRAIYVGHGCKLPESGLSSPQEMKVALLKAMHPLAQAITAHCGSTVSRQQNQIYEK